MNASLDARIAALMHAQHGVAHRDQLVALGLSARAISHRTAAGRLHRIAPCVYALVPPRSRTSWWMAGVLACGPDAVLSHESAAALWDVDRSARRESDARPVVHVLTNQTRAPADFIVVHRTSDFDARDRVSVRGIPVTSIERTIFDLASTRTEHQLADVVHEACFHYDVHIDYLRGLAARRRGAHHSEVVLGMLALVEAGVRGTRSELEDAFLRMLEAEGIRIPEMNVRVRPSKASYVLDALWRRERVAVELDGKRSHGRPRSRRDDAARDEALRKADATLVRLRWIDLHARRAATVRRIKRLIR